MLKDLKKIVEKKTDDKITIEKYKRLLRESPGDNPEIHLKLGKLYEKIGQKQTALKEYIIAARLYAHTEETVKAIAANKLIVRLDPENKDALANLAFMHHFQQEDESLVEEYETFLQEIDRILEEQQEAEEPVIIL